jgi:hypothetical protein
MMIIHSGVLRSAWLCATEKTDKAKKIGRASMKRSIALGLIVLLAGLVSAQAFTQPTAQQLLGAANDPSQVGSLLQGASPEESSAVILGIVAEVEKMEIPLEQKKQRVAAILAAAQVALGEQAEAVMAMVTPSIAPELLPAVGAVAGPIAPLSLPISQPLAPPVKPPEGPGQPPVAQTYPGQ